MAKVAKVGKRDLVKAEIKKGTQTKIQIAESLEMSPASVASQMTYLRWMGKFIKYDADKVLSFCTEEEYDAWQDELKANRKTKAVSTKTPQEQANALAKTIKTQNGTMAKWQKKVNDAELALVDEPEDAELLECVEEGEANVTLLKIKIRRNEERASELPEPAEVEAPAAETTDADEDVEEEELL